MQILYEKYKDYEKNLQFTCIPVFFLLPLWPVWIVTFRTAALLRLKLPKHLKLLELLKL